MNSCEPNRQKEHSRCVYMAVLCFNSIVDKKEKLFIQIVQTFYAKNGRHNLPWRKTKNPYRIHLSEVMLQQTQVDRVIPKYKAFLKAFPTVTELANVSLGEVLQQWQGLGYNRRAKMLHNCAKEIVRTCHGTYPSTYQKLCQLPGIGPYTAGAISAFVYNKPVPVIETNIRTVYTHHFFREATDISDEEILRYIVVTLDHENPREWYWALMDYGTYLKKEYGSINSRSKHYIKQSNFQGSDRQIRGAIVRTLAEATRPLSRISLLKKLSNFEDIRIDAQLKGLLEEGMVTKTKQSYHLPS